MNTKPPEVSRSAWQRLCSAAGRLKQLEPWKRMTDIDFIGFKAPKTGEPHVTSVCHDGEHYVSFAVYRGAGGFSFCHWQLNRGPTTEDELTYYNNQLDALVLEFRPKDQLTETDLKAMRTGRLRKCNPPLDGVCFRSLRPYYLPWYLEEQEALLLAMGIRRFLEFFEVFGDGKEVFFQNLPHITFWEPLDAETYGDDAWMMNSADIPRPSDVVDPPSFSPYEETAARIRGMRFFKNGVWELQVQPAPLIVTDSVRPYVLRDALLIDRATERALYSNPLGPEASAADVRVSALFKAVEEGRSLPAEVHVLEREKDDLLQNACDAIGIALVQRTELPVAKTAYDRLCRLARRQLN